MARFPLGRNATLNYSTTGPVASMQTAGNIKDVTLNLATVEDDDTVRDNQGWETTCAVLRQSSLDFEMKSDGTDPFYLAVEANYYDGVPFRVIALNGPLATVGSKGVIYWVTVTNFTRTENIGEVQKYQVTLKPANPPAGNATEQPDRYEVE